MMTGMAFGAGSAVAHQVVGSMMGGGSGSHGNGGNGGNDQQQQQQAPMEQQ